LMGLALFLQGNAQLVFADHAFVDQYAPQRLLNFFLQLFYPGLVHDAISEPVRVHVVIIVRDRTLPGAFRPAARRVGNTA